MLCQEKNTAEGGACDLMSHGPICSMFAVKIYDLNTRYSSVVILPRSTDKENKKVIHKNKKVIHTTFIEIKLFRENAYISMS